MSTKNITQETARVLRQVADERSAMIGMLQREVKELEAALADAEERRGTWMAEGAPAVDPILEEKLDKV